MFEAFLKNLSTYLSTPTLTNPYQCHISPYNDQRRHNLQLYLEQMVLHMPKLLLVGEAPGYRGCRLTGVPFVSNQLLLNGAASLGLFGEAAGYRPVDEWTTIQREASSTIMWQTIAQLSRVPLVWNACPFHPHLANAPQSNRTPLVNELAAGRPFLTQLLTLFPIMHVVAVGNKADFALRRWGISHQKVRHPSHGGKRPFQEQLLAIDRAVVSRS